MNKEKVIKEVRLALKDHIIRDDIILEYKRIYSKDVIMTGTLFPLPSFKHVGTTTHSVSIFTFINIYEDIFNSIFIRKGNRLPVMLKKKFIVNGDKIVESGYNPFIQQWIEEGIKL